MEVLILCKSGNFLFNEFTFLSKEYFFKYSWAFLGIQLSYLETFWFFHDFLFWFVRWDKNAIWARTNLAPLFRQYIMPYVLWEFSTLAGGNVNYSCLV